MSENGTSNRFLSNAAYVAAAVAVGTAAGTAEGSAAIAVPSAAYSVGSVYCCVPG